jgi:hypothetical protein
MASISRQSSHPERVAVLLVCESAVDALVSEADSSTSEAIHKSMPPIDKPMSPTYVQHGTVFPLMVCAFFQ